VSEPKPRLKLSAELSDGSSWSVTDADGAIAAFREWVNDFADHPGESCSVEIVMMTDEEVEALPPL
jgi:hypothetical protein